MKQTSDPSAAVRADPKRPTECPECGSAVEFECGAWWCTRKRCKHFNKFVISVGDQPHVPAPANEHQDHSPAEIEQERGEVFKVLPPLEIADHADALGWTPESRVYECGDSFDVYPAERYIRKGYPGAHDSGLSEESFLKCVKGYTLLPNRRVQGEGEKVGTATAWDGGVTIQNDYLRMATDAPDGKAFMWCKSNPLETLRRMVDEYVAEREKRAVERSKLIAKAAQSGFDAMMADAPRPAKSAGEVAEEVVEEWSKYHQTRYGTARCLPKLTTIITAAIERERGSR